MTNDNGYTQVMDTLSARFGTAFAIYNTGGGCEVIHARLEGGLSVSISDRDDFIGHIDDHEQGYWVGIYADDEDGGDHCIRDMTDDTIESADAVALGNLIEAALKSLADNGGRTE